MQCRFDFVARETMLRLYCYGCRLQSCSSHEPNAWSCASSRNGYALVTHFCYTGISQDVLALEYHTLKKLTYQWYYFSFIFVQPRGVYADEIGNIPDRKDYHAQWKSNSSPHVIGTQVGPGNRITLHRHWAAHKPYKSVPCRWLHRLPPCSISLSKTVPRTLLDVDTFLLSCTNRTRITRCTQNQIQEVSLSQHVSLSSQLDDQNELYVHPS